MMSFPMRKVVFHKHGMQVRVYAQIYMRGDVGACRWFAEQARPHSVAVADSFDPMAMLNAAAAAVHFQHASHSGVPQTWALITSM